MNIFSIVVTWNGDKWIEKCLASLRDSALRVSVIIIDNASTDQTVHIIKNKFPEYQLIETVNNLGFGKANNIGLEMALQLNAEYVFLLNQDAWIESNSLQNMVNVHKVNPKYGILSPIHFNSDHTELEYKFLEYIQPGMCPGFVSDYIMGKLTSVYETTFVNAAAWLISKDCLQTVGGFDPLFPHYGEDVDFVERAKYFGYKTGIVPNSKVWHDSKIVSWPEILQNRKRMLTIYMSELKNVGGSLRSNLLIFLKRHFDDLSSHLLFRRFKMFAYKSGLIAKSLMKIRAISKARKLSKMKGAFLQMNK